MKDFLDELLRDKILSGQIKENPEDIDLDFLRDLGQKTEIF